MLFGEEVDCLPVAAVFEGESRTEERWSTSEGSCILQYITCILFVLFLYGVNLLVCFVIHQLDVYQLCVYQLCVYQLCVYQLCVYQLCVYQLCVYQLCVYQLCVYQLCVYQLCVYQLCVYQLCVYQLCVHQLCVSAGCLTMLHSGYFFNFFFFLYQICHGDIKSENVLLTGWNW